MLIICSWACVAFRILYQEIDYINEGKNADRFRRDFRNIKWVRVPVCFLHHDDKTTNAYSYRFYISIRHV